MKYVKTWGSPLAVLAIYTLLLVCAPAEASLESSLNSLKTKLSTVILPALAVMGVVFAALSFFSGNPNAKQHITYAIGGCIFGFGAQAIVDFIAQAVN